jgi:1-deoxy-D-xylulose-5-phosphate reductoisomerase
MKKRLVILGSAGSVGENALRVVQALGERFEVVGLAVRGNHRRLLEQARQCGVRRVALADPEAAAVLRRAAPDLAVLCGDAGLEELAALPEADLVLCAVVGMAGLKPVLAALRRGTPVALATKEVLVAAGAMVTETSRANDARLLPVDSEHSALFQCLEGRPAASVRRLWLTASGGPFAQRHDVDLDRVTVTEALQHPRWKMGRKVTVDSATLMNKGLEIIEAHWLFAVAADCIDVVIHPESIVHSLVEFVDGSMLAQMSPPDMRHAIQYALTWPERVDGRLPSLDLVETGPLHFRTPDPARFPALRLAREAVRVGGTLPAVMNAANEVAVQHFLNGSIAFSGIWGTVESVMERHAPSAGASLEDILAADAWARSQAEAVCGARHGALRPERNPSW